MSYALVGAVGAVSQGVSGAAVTPAWGTGESRTAGNLLVLLVSVVGAQTIPAAPSGWSSLQQANVSATPSGSASIFAMIAAGADAQPTVAAITSGVIAAQLLEFSGNDSAANTGDKIAHASVTTTSPIAAAAVGNDVTVGELVCWAAAIGYTTAATKTFTPTLNNGQVANVTSSAALSTVNHYWFDWSTQTGIATNDQCSLAVTTTKLGSGVLVGASFPLPLPVKRIVYPVVSQAVQRAASRMSVYRRKSGILVPRIWAPDAPLVI